MIALLSCGLGYSQNSAVELKPLTTCKNSIFDTEDRPDEIFRHVSSMPSLVVAGCEKINDNMTKHNCAREYVIDYILNGLSKDFDASKFKKDLKVTVSFVIEREGCMADIRIVEPKGSEVEKQIQQLVTKLPKWIAGKQRGQSVPVIVYLPLDLSMKGRSSAK